MDFRINNGLTHNSLLNRGNKDAAYKQTELEHNEALNKYIRPGMTPLEMMAARSRGEAEEKLLPKYWDDELPRQSLNPSSSFIDDVTVIPSLNMARIRIGNKTYTYPMKDTLAGDMVTNFSIGEFYNDNVKRK